MKAAQRIMLVVVLLYAPLCLRTGLENLPTTHLVEGSIHFSQHISLCSETVPNLTVEVTAIDSEFTQQERLYFMLI